jgi:hypothetical protein
MYRYEFGPGLVYLSDVELPPAVADAVDRLLNESGGDDDVR